MATTVKMLDEQEHEGNSDGKVDCGVSCIVRCNYKSVVSIKCQLSYQFPLRIDFYDHSVGRSVLEVPTYQVGFQTNKCVTYESGDFSRIN